VAALAALGGAWFTPTTMIDGKRYLRFPNPSVGSPLICTTETPRVEGEERATGHSPPSSLCRPEQSATAASRSLVSTVTCVRESTAT
ncbi:uncharacterized protein METZ01_LOCUS146607, partial [marine metagenome]